MTRTIFLLSEDGDMKEMALTTYPTEDLLQRLLAEHPSVLSSVHTDEQVGHQWLLVAREAGVPDEEGGAGRWSLDHLFLDREGIPTLIEVKRSSDTRIRREVVGQMLDYAANSVAYWPIEKVQAFFAATMYERDPSADPDATLEKFLRGERSPSEFWEDVKTNLQAGKVRLVFVADAIPKELRRIIEFLNEQMDPAEVLAIEVKQYVAVGERERTLVPTLIGRTAMAESRKQAGTISERRTWNEESFFERASEQLSSAEVRALRELYDFSVARADRVTFGTGTQTVTFNVKFDRISPRSLYSVSAKNELWFNFNWIEGEAGGLAKQRLLEFLLDHGIEVPDDIMQKFFPVPPDLWTLELAGLKLAIEEVIADG